MRLWFALFLASTLSAAAQAKVFSYQNTKFAAFIRGGGGQSRLAQDAFANNGGATTKFPSDEVQYGFSGEIGAFYRAGPLGVRLGIEALRPKELEIPGNNSGGTKQYTLTSAVFAFSPTLTFEYAYSGINNTLFYGFFGGGYTTVTLDNQVALTATGTAAYPGVTDYTEKSGGSNYMGLAGIGFETVFTDNVTFSMDAGYRYLIIKNLKYSGDATTVHGAVVKGAKVLNADGSDRVLDLSGAMINATFKFYLNF